MQTLTRRPSFQISCTSRVARGGHDDAASPSSCGGIGPVAAVVVGVFSTSPMWTLRPLVGVRPQLVVAGTAMRRTPVDDVAASRPDAIVGVARTTRPTACRWEIDANSHWDAIRRGIFLSSMVLFVSKENSSRVMSNVEANSNQSEIRLIYL